MIGWREVIGIEGGQRVGVRGAGDGGGVVG